MKMAKTESRIGILENAYHHYSKNLIYLIKNV